ncbi:MAG: cell division protein FtsQ/DivIB [Bacteroidales bacterium]
MKKQKIIKAIVWVFILGFVVGIISLLQRQRDAMLCDTFMINVSSKNSPTFLTKKDVSEILDARDIVPGTKKVGDLNLDEIESVLCQNPLIHNAEVSLSFLGELKIHVIEKQPIAQVFSLHDDSYFICDDNSLMPFYLGGNSRVPIVNGYIQTTYKKNLGLIFQDTLLKELVPILTLVKEIQKSSLLQAQIEQLYIKKNREIQLIPKVGNHIVEFGTPENYKRKLENLEVFYSKGISQVGWNKYRTISLKFDNQVVCTKN